ncbi:MAG: dolichol-P-glucose synthetase [Deltaproteobacteria bacterium CG11_big_fil_rev_8_21_14_0_20_45_16]|nr:MAG: dolichol-P-glucose synthetase [Deltaproteobacteria bacterium CG11_big_fil_rev_8_21_14_0_20_45_16]
MAGATVIEERRRGYGSALLRGMRDAKGDYIVMGDADNTYDFEDAVPLVEKLKQGAEFAIGDRLAGKVEPGAMPWLHHHLGTPVLSWVLSFFYGGKIHDINCGLRAIRKSSLEKLRLRSPGMEFASEMVIHAQKADLKIAEHPIRYYRRGGGVAKLRTFRDGWRHLRFILLFAPFHFFMLPAIAGLIVGGYLFSFERKGYLVTGSLGMLLGYQILLFGIFAKTYLWVTDSFVVDRIFGSWIEMFKLEYGILKSLLIVLIGVIFFAQWDLANLIRGATFLALGVQTFFSSFFISIILFKTRDNIQ